MLKATDASSFGTGLNSLSPPSPFVPPPSACPLSFPAALYRVYFAQKKCRMSAKNAGYNKLVGLPFHCHPSIAPATASPSRDKVAELSGAHVVVCGHEKVE